MNRKQLAILLVLVIGLGGAGLLLLKRESASRDAGSQGVGTKLLGDFPVNDVAHITIKAEGSQVNLVRKDDRWRVSEREGYLANFDGISDLLLKMRDLKAVQSEQVGPAQLPRLDLTPPGQGTNSGVLLEFRDKGDKVIKSVLLGKQHMRKSNRPNPYGMGDEGWPDGRWVKVADAQTVALISDPLSNFEPKPEHWLNKDFFKVEKVRSIAVNFPNATNSWQLTRESESGQWKLTDPKPEEQLDLSKASGVANPLMSPSFVDVKPAGAPAEETGLDEPTVVTVETFDHFTYTVRVGDKAGDNYHLAVAVAANLPKERTAGAEEPPEDKEKLDKEFADRQKTLQEKLKQEKKFEDWVYLVSNWTVDGLLKTRSQLLAEKKEETKEEEKEEEEATEDVAPEEKPAESPGGG